jgi:hypothetical protein
MSVGLLVVRLLYRFYALGHLSKWFIFFSFKFVFVYCVVSFYACCQQGLHGNAGRNVSYEGFV